MRKFKRRHNPEIDTHVYWQISLHAPFAMQLIDITSTSHEAKETARRLQHFFNEEGIDVSVYLFKVTRHIEIEDGEYIGETQEEEELSF